MPRGQEAIERRLADLAGEVEFPPTPEIAAAIRTRVEEQAGGRRTWRGPARRTLAIGLTTLLVAGATAYAASPAFRDALRDLLDIGGVRIERVEELPLVPERTELDLGEPVSMSEATRRAGFAPLVPSSSALGPPSGVHIRDADGVAIVSLVWDPNATLPESAQTGTGLLLSEFRARLDHPVFRKQIADTRVVPVRIGGERGYWLRGPEHVIAYRGGGGGFVTEPRLAGNTLVWQRGPTTLRLEGEIPKARALRIARSLR
jgi:hypothetical protein